MALLAQPLWQRAFVGQEDVVGRTILVNGVSRRVVGVMPPGFDVADAGVQLWLPFVLDPANRQNRSSHVLDLIGRVRPGVTLEQVRPHRRIRPEYLHLLLQAACGVHIVKELTMLIERPCRAWRRGSASRSRRCTAPRGLGCGCVADDSGRSRGSRAAE